MTFWQQFLIGWLAASGVAVFIRGVVGSNRTYTFADSILGSIEIAFLIWIVAVKL